MRTAFVRVRVGHVGFDRGSGNFRFLRIGQGFSTVALREWDGGVQGFRVGIERMSDVQRWLRGVGNGRLFIVDFIICLIYARRGGVDLCGDDVAFGQLDLVRRSSQLTAGELLDKTPWVVYLCNEVAVSGVELVPI